MDPKWREILEKVERGELTPEDGAAQMRQEPSASVPPQSETPPNPAGGSENIPPEPDPGFESRLNYWKRWWILPLWGGVGIFLLGALLIAWGNAGKQVFWFVCGFFPLLLGLLVMLLAWWSQTARWVHVRVQSNKEGRKARVAISMPLPIRFTGWILSTFGSSIPGLREQPNVTEMLPELFHELSHNREPIVVEVNDNEDEKVQVYIT
jgi:hypothetical protein